MTVDYRKAPFPYFGSKADAALFVWAALGDVAHYVEPFTGSLAALLRRPHECNRTYYSETVNDLDGYLVNAWRSLALHPDETAEWASWPVSECDIMARHLWLLRWKTEENWDLLRGDPEWCDPKAAGYWMWGQSCWIASGWCHGTGPWTVDASGRVFKQGKGGGRASGVSGKRPHISNNGQGVNRPRLREPGVAIGTPGRPWMPEDFHPMTMPELRAWFAFLSARLRHVRILQGDWKRAVTNGAMKTLPVRQGKGICGVFLDPPYAAEADRADGLYTCDDLTVSHDVRRWCIERGDDPDLRIVLAGYSGEGHEELLDHGWREQEWYAGGFLRGGMANMSERGTQQRRERLWMSPHCLQPVDVPEIVQCNLWEDEG